MTRLQSSIICWAPRVLALCYALFISIFAMDVFDEKLGFWQTIAALGVHLIPTWIVLIVLALAWRREWIGAVLYAAAAVIYSIKVLPKHPDWATFIALPLLLVAGLYLLAWMKHRPQKMAH